MFSNRFRVLFNLKQFIVRNIEMHLQQFFGLPFPKHSKATMMQELFMKGGQMVLGIQMIPYLKYWKDWISDFYDAV